MIYRRFYKEEFDAGGVLAGAALSYPEDFNYGYDVIDPLALAQPQKLAMRWRDFKGEERCLTFGDLKAHSDRAASLFRSWGMEKGDVLMVCLRTHYSYWIIALAAHKLGLILAPVYHLLSVEDLAYRMEKSGAKAVISIRDGDTPKRVLAAADRTGISLCYTVGGPYAGFLDFDEAQAAAPAALSRAETLAHEPILLYFTSGTTGEPKGVLHDHAFTLPAALGARYMQDAGPDSLHFATGNTAWEVVCGTKFYGHWLCEAALFIYDYDRFDPKVLLEELSSARVSSIMAQPTIYRQMTGVGMDRYDLSSITCYAVGGEKLMKDVSLAVYRQTGHRLFEGYAQSEAGLIAANSKNMGRKSGSVGRVLPKYRLEILREDGSFAVPNEQGEIVLVAPEGQRPPGLLMGYFGDPGAGESLWEGDLFHTGDFGYLDEEGFLFYLGRTDGLIKTKGYRVSPVEIENALSRHPAVHECLVVGKADSAYGQKICAYVQLETGVASSDTLREELLAFHNENCTGFQKIRALEFVPSFARNDNGKIIRGQFTAEA